MSPRPLILASARIVVGTAPSCCRARSGARFAIAFGAVPVLHDHAVTLPSLSRFDNAALRKKNLSMRLPRLLQAPQKCQQKHINNHKIYRSGNSAAPAPPSQTARMAARANSQRQRLQLTLRTLCISLRHLHSKRCHRLLPLRYPALLDHVKSCPFEMAVHDGPDDVDEFEPMSQDTETANG